MFSINELSIRLESLKKSKPALHERLIQVNRDLKKGLATAVERDRIALEIKETNREIRRLESQVSLLTYQVLTSTILEETPYGTVIRTVE